LSILDSRLLTTSQTNPRHISSLLKRSTLEKYPNQSSLWILTEI